MSSEQSLLHHTPAGREHPSLTVPVHQGAEVNDTLAILKSAATARPVAVPGMPARQRTPQPRRGWLTSSNAISIRQRLTRRSCHDALA